MSQLLPSGAKKELTIKQNQYSDCVFSWGGDGSLLKQLRDNIRTNKKIVGVCGAERSFLSYPIQKLRIEPKDFMGYSFIQFEQMDNVAVGDFILQGKPLLEATVYVNDVLVENFRGSSIIISTWLGATGINKSHQGPLLMPESKMLIMNFVGGQQGFEYKNINSPLIVDGVIKLIFKPSVIYLDGHSIEVKGNELKMKLVNSTSKIYLPNYWERLRTAFGDS